jgi:hypothetical protein
MLPIFKISSPDRYKNYRLIRVLVPHLVVRKYAVRIQCELGLRCLMLCNI